MDNVLIISITSDIGLSLAKRYVDNGDNVVGTYRSSKPHIECPLFHCDIDKESSVDEFVSGYAQLGIRWDVVIFCPCNPLPLKPFFECDFKEWEESIMTNAINQLRVLHKLYEFKTDGIANVVFFAGGGINTSVTNFSAYTASKVFLVKMCELLADENGDMNIFALGPGWVKTKIHNLILDNVDKADKRFDKTVEFLNYGVGTSFDDIYNKINLLCKTRMSSGRNFTTSDSINFYRLKDDSYKLRRNETEGSV